MAKNREHCLKKGGTMMCGASLDQNPNIQYKVNRWEYGNLAADVRCPECDKGLNKEKMERPKGNGKARKVHTEPDQADCSRR